MAKLIREGQLSAREAVEAHLTQIENVNPKVNAIVTLVADQARQRAFEADEAQAAGQSLGPLHGLPTAHKDLQPTNGIRTTFGSRIFKDFVPEQDSLLVERVRARRRDPAGQNQYARIRRGIADLQRSLRGYSQSFRHDENLRRQQRRRGGVTGLSHGPDRRWHRSGWIAAQSGQLLQCCGVATVAGPRARAACCRSLRTKCGRPDGAFRGGYCVLLFGYGGARSDLLTITGPRLQRCPHRLVERPRGIPIDPRVRDITNAQRRVFESLGCIVEEAEPDFTGADETFRTLRFQSTSLRMADHMKRHPDLIKDTLLWEIEQGNRLSAGDVADAEMKHTELCRRMSRFLESYEFFVLPVSQVLPFDVSQHCPKRNRRDQTYDLYRLDEVLLLHFGYGDSIDLGSLRIHERRLTHRHSNRGPPPG